MLFPVLLSPHDVLWAEYYAMERLYLLQVFGKQIARISHIGSTAIPNLIAKPTIDILLELHGDIELHRVTKLLDEAGYVTNTPSQDIIMYLKGYTPQGFAGQAVHVHVRMNGNWDELYFRDYLLVHPEAAIAYGQLKLSLIGRFRYDRDAYTEAKGPFIRTCTVRAREEFPCRYVPSVSR